MVMGGWEFEAHTDASMENISQASYQTLFEKWVWYTAKTSYLFDKKVSKTC